MSYKYSSPRSKLVLSEIHIDLAAIAVRGLDILSSVPDGFDVSLTDGLRTQGEAELNRKNGFGIVRSKHLPGPDGKARAFDWAPAGVGDPFPRQGDSKAIVAEKMRRWRTGAAAFLQAADELAIIVRSGCDWDGNSVTTEMDKAELKAGNKPDYPHIELVSPGEFRYSVMVKARTRRMVSRLKGEKWPL